MTYRSVLREQQRQLQAQHSKLLDSYSSALMCGVQSRSVARKVDSTMSLYVFELVSCVRTTTKLCMLLAVRQFHSALEQCGNRTFIITGEVFVLVS